MLDIIIYSAQNNPYFGLSANAQRMMLLILQYVNEYMEFKLTERLTHNYIIDNSCDFNLDTFKELIQAGLINKIDKTYVINGKYISIGENMASISPRVALKRNRELCKLKGNNLVSTRFKDQLKFLQFRTLDSPFKSDIVKNGVYKYREIQQWIEGLCKKYKIPQEYLTKNYERTEVKRRDRLRLCKNIPRKIGGQPLGR